MPFDLQRCFHVGMPVSDIEAARKNLGGAMNVDWSPVRVFDPLPFWTPERGAHEVVVHACYSRQGPQHMELCQGTGDFYDPSSGPDARHIGVWVDDLPREASDLLSRGWTVVAGGAAPDDGFGSISYMAPPMGGLLVELVSADLKPFIDSWMRATD